MLGTAMAGLLTVAGLSTAATAGTLRAGEILGREAEKAFGAGTKTARNEEGRPLSITELSKPR